MTLRSCAFIKRHHKFICTLSVFFILLLVVFFNLLYNVVHFKHSYTPVKSDGILILGYSLEDGVTPRDWLVIRLEVGLELFERGFGDHIVVSGGKGKKDKQSVAFSMKQWLQDNGVSEDKIIIEDRSQNTYENFIYTKVIAEQRNLNTMIVVTNDFHMYRSMLIGGNYFDGLSGLDAAVPFGINKFLAYLKEPLSIVKYFAIR